jgi:hypothetical protein
MNPDKSGAIKNEDGEIVAYSATKVTQMRENHERQIAEMAAARKKDKERQMSWDGSPRPQTVYRGQYDQPRYDARHDEGQHDPRRDRK